jgi:hypothetical protein
MVGAALMVAITAVRVKALQAVEVAST